MLDASIYQNVAAPKIDMPNPMDSAGKALSLAQLGMQNQALQQQQATTQAMRQAYARNTGPDGQLNRQGFLADLARANPMAAQDQSEKFSKMDKDRADAQTAQMQAMHQQASIAVPHYGYLLGLPDDQAKEAYPQIVKQLSDAGVDTKNLPPEYDRNLIDRGYRIASHYKEQLENQLTQANTGKARSETAMAPAKLAAELYGSRSPNAELTSQFNNEPATKTAKSSQVAMNQMIDNYNHPSPQGDASLVLNAFKIKFPNAPDVNSLKELSESQAASDNWKQMANKVLSGGLDQNTRDNLMRDGVSTFRANVGSIKDVQDQYKERQRQQGVNDPTLTRIPAIDKTFEDAMALQKKIGPYVPPAERGGFFAGVNNLASKLVGGASQKEANASTNSPADKPATRKITVGAIVNVGGRHYRVGEDGDSLIPIQGKGKQ